MQQHSGQVFDDEGCSLYRLGNIVANILQTKSIALQEIKAKNDCLAKSLLYIV